MTSWKRLKRNRLTLRLNKNRNYRPFLGKFKKIFFRNIKLIFNLYRIKSRLLKSHMISTLKETENLFKSTKKGSKRLRLNWPSISRNCKDLKMKMKPLLEIITISKWIMRNWNPIFRLKRIMYSNWKVRLIVWISRLRIRSIMGNRIWRMLRLIIRRREECGRTREKSRFWLFRIWRINWRRCIWIIVDWDKSIWNCLKLCRIMLIRRFFLLLRIIIIIDFFFFSY